MKTLSIFDGVDRIATISIIGDRAFIFARTSREWSEMKRLVDSGYDVKVSHPKFLQHVAKRAQSYDFNTELV